MDKDRIKGSAEQGKGKVKEIAGKVTGDSKLEGEGKADQIKAKFKTPLAASRIRCAGSSKKRTRRSAEFCVCTCKEFSTTGVASSPRP